MIERLYISQMGKINHVDFLLHRHNVICGVNESGKSTLIEAIKAAYFGFPSKKSQGFKYGASAVQFEWSMEDETCFLVERTLSEQRQSARIIGMRRNAEHEWSSSTGLEQAEKVETNLKIIPLPVRRELFELLFCVDENRLHLFRKEEWNLASSVLLDSVSGGVINNIDEVRAEIQDEKKALYSTRANAKSSLKGCLEELKTVEESLRAQEAKDHEYRRIQSACAETEERLATLTEESSVLREKLGYLRHTFSDYQRTLSYQRLKENRMDVDVEESIRMISGCKDYISKSKELANAIRRVEGELSILPPLKPVNEELVQAKKKLPLMRKDYLEYLQRESEKRLKLEERKRLEEMLSTLPQIHPEARLDHAELISKRYQKNSLGALEIGLVLLAGVLVGIGLFLKVDLLSLMAIFLSVLTILLFVLRGGSRRGLAQAFAKAMNDEKMASLVSSADSSFFERARTASAYGKRLRSIAETDLAPKEEMYLEYGGFDAYCERCEHENEVWVDNQRLIERRTHLEAEMVELRKSWVALERENLPMLHRVFELSKQEWHHPSDELLYDEVLVIKLNHGVRALESDLRIRELMEELEREGKVDFIWADDAEYSLPALERMEQQCVAYDEAILECKSAIAEYRASLTNVAYDPSLEGRRQYLETEIERLHIGAKRLGFFEYLLEDSVRKYREKHQPAFAKKISEYLSLILGEEVQILVDTSKGFSYELIRRGEVVSYLGAMSTGFVQQLALCSRLALMDVVDPLKQLPIVLDDTFAFWDDERRIHAFELLSSLGRVIYYATCSEERLPANWIIINMLKE